jgi:eukaryotic-like serine/threonine-protein kinase
LREEARLGATLAHPNIVQVLDCGRFRDTFIVALELVDGISLARLRGTLSPAAIAFVGCELATALDYIHTRRGSDGRPLELVHRDLNPPNVLVSRIGEVKLADFGVAAASTRAVIHNQGGMFYGKSAYAAPEQLAGLAVDAKTDIYGLGVTLRETWTGRDSDPLRALLDELGAAAPELRPSAIEARDRLRALGSLGDGERELVCAVDAALAQRTTIDVTRSAMTAPTT